MPAPWDAITDPELREHLDTAMFVMVEIGGLDPRRAWNRVDEWNLPQPDWSALRRGLWFHHSPVDHGLDLAWGRGWWLLSALADTVQPRPSVYARYDAALADGSWEARKRAAFDTDAAG